MKSFRIYFQASFKPGVICAVILFLIISTNGGFAFAGNYTVKWWYLQKRSYEDGSSFNRLGFWIADEFDVFVSNDVVKSVSLVGPAGSIAIGSHNFDQYETLSGEYDENSGKWYYDTEFKSESVFMNNFSGNLVDGVYTLEVIDKDGDLVFNYSPTRNFNHVVLPKFSSKTFRGGEDAHGNLIWQWGTPMDTSLWSSNSDLSIRCGIRIYKNNDPTDDVGDVYVKVPAMFGGMYIPNWVMDLSRQKGDYFRLYFHIRTNDNNNRYYTNEVALNALRKERRKAVAIIPIF